MIKIDYIGVRRKPLAKLLPKQHLFQLDKASDIYFSIVGTSNDAAYLAVVNVFSVKTHQLCSSTSMRYDTLVYPIELVNFDTKALDKYVY